MKKRLLVILAVVALLIGVSTTSFAETIDFTDGSWSGANGQFDFGPIDGTTLTAYPYEDATLWQDSIDGIGVVYDYEEDEIEGPDEILKISFDETTLLNTIYIADLFIETEGGDLYNETGEYSLNDGSSWIGFTAVQVTLGTNGELTIDVGGVLVDSILFRAPGEVSDTQFEEFAVQGLEVNVPEPGTIALLGMGLVGLIGAGARRKLKKKN